MLTTIVLLLISLAVILAGAELFTNGIEWFGRRLRLAEGAVGSVLAAVGTALPETMIPLMALLFGHGEARKEIGIGAILGAPLMLSTLAFFVTGLAVFTCALRKRRTLTMSVSHIVLGRDLRSFFTVYAVAIGAMFLPGKPLKVLTAVFLIGAYVYYVRNTFCCVEGLDTECELGPLHFHRNAHVPRLRIVTLQVAVALLFILGGARAFVDNLSVLARAAGVSTFVLAAIITPVATELPEKFNSITWIRQRKDTLALGNISGAMVFQSSVLPAIGILFTRWSPDPQALITGLAALFASIFAWAELTWRKRLSPYTLLAGVLFYIPWVAYMLTTGRH